mgnify:CR=1 FL=1
MANFSVSSPIQSLRRSLNIIPDELINQKDNEFINKILLQKNKIEINISVLLLYGDSNRSRSHDIFKNNLVFNIFDIIIDKHDIISKSDISTIQDLISKIDKLFINNNILFIFGGSGYTNGDNIFNFLQNDHNFEEIIYYRTIFSNIYQDLNLDIADLLKTRSTAYFYKDKIVILGPGHPNGSETAIRCITPYLQDLIGTRTRK